MGCTRSYTAADHLQMRNSRQQNPKQKTIAPSLGSKADTRSSILDASRNTIISILKDKNHAAYDAVASILGKSLGCNKKTIKEEKIPDALLVILKDHPEAMDIFKDRGRKSSDKSRLYEIKSIAALKTRVFVSSSGKPLAINLGDKVDFSMKLLKGRPQNREVQSIQADTLVYKTNETIAIDQKYSRSNERGVPDQAAFSKQLEGIKTGLLDNKIDTFFFITNVSFSNKFTEMVEETNRQIAFEFSNKHGHSQNEDLKEHPDPNAPQIQLCQQVTYNGG